MTVANWGWWIAGVFSALVLLELLRLDLLLFRALSVEPKLTDVPPPIERKNGSLVSIIVPAKNEESFITACVKAILHATYQNIEIILVNDRSTDRTGDLMADLARDDVRIKIVTITERPGGWTGKTYALYRGVKESKGDLLLFTDADAVMQPDTISRAVTFLEGHRLEMLSLLPGFSRRGFAEDVAFMHMAIGIQLFFPLPEVNNPSKPVSLAAGCFMLMRRAAYERIGTWERVRSELTEDVALSRVLKTSGARIMTLRGSSFIQTRPFHSVWESCSFWKRTYYGALEKDPRKLVQLAGKYLALCVTWVLFGLSTIAVTGETPLTPAYILFALTGLSASAITVSTAVLLKQERGNAWYATLSVVGIFLTTYVAFDTLVTVLGDHGIKWRGSVYR